VPANYTAAHRADQERETNNRFRKATELTATNLENRNAATAAKAAHFPQNTESEKGRFAVIKNPVVFLYFLPSTQQLHTSTLPSFHYSLLPSSSVRSTCSTAAILTPWYAWELYRLVPSQGAITIVGELSLRSANNRCLDADKALIYLINTGIVTTCDLSLSRTHSCSHELTQR